MCSSKRLEFPPLLATDTRVQSSRSELTLCRWRTFTCIAQPWYKMFPARVTHLASAFPLPFRRGTTGCVTWADSWKEVARGDAEIGLTSGGGAEGIAGKSLWILAVGGFAAGKYTARNRNWNLQDLCSKVRTGSMCNAKPWYEVINISFLPVSPFNDFPKHLPIPKMSSSNTFLFLNIRGNQL